MTFFNRRPLLILSALLCVMALLLPIGCRRTVSNNEKQIRADLRRALSEHSYQTATVLARRVIQFAPQDNGAWERLVQAQLGVKDLAGAKQSLLEWGKAVWRPSAKFHEYSGDIALKEGDRSSALIAWRKSAEINARNPRVYRKIAVQEQSAHHWQEAVAAWSGILKIQDSAEGRINRALCSRRIHQWESALRDLHRAQQLAPNDDHVRRQTESFDRFAKFLPEVRDIDKELAALPNDSSLLCDRALLFLRASDAQLALDDAEAAIKSSTTAVRPRLFQALALIGLGRVGEVAKLSVHPSIALGSLSSEFLQTISRLDSEISAEPKNPELYVDRAWQLNEIGQPALALADAEKALELDAKSSGACAESSYALKKLGRDKESLDRIKRTTELDPNFSTAWQYRGELEMQNSDYPAAIDSLTRALQINQTAGALEKREECYRRVGLIAKAQQDHHLLEQFRATR